MGKTVSGAEMGRVAEGSVAALNAAVGGIAFFGRFNITIAAQAFVGSIVLERSFDAGATWHICTVAGAVASFSGSASEVVEESEPAVMYRLRVASYTSGSAYCRLSGPQ